jgi:4-hydroxy-4-methyl-2-oxoglutarate aldolase
VTAKPVVNPGTLEEIRRFDTCTVANAIERFGVRLKNEGYTQPGLQCVTGGCPRILGYAATFLVRSADPPLTGGSYWDRTDWWEALEGMPDPRIAIIQSVGQPAGAVLGAVHAAILKAFQCEGLVTDGAVRDVPDVAEMQFPMFARGMAVSHAYRHIVEFGGPVEILGLRIHAGDLLLADLHGVVSIPPDVAGRIPAVAAEIRDEEQRIIRLCRSREFSRARLEDAIQNS